MRIILGLIFSVLAVTQACAASLEDDVLFYVSTFNGETGLHSSASEKLGFAGISDVRVFDIVEKLLLRDAPTVPSDRENKLRVAYYIRALGFSGQSKYIPTLRGFKGDLVYELYAKNALEDMPNYQKWNPVIANRASFDPKYSDDVNRVINMLKSDDLMLKRVGAKRVYFANKDEVLLELLAKDLKANYTRDMPDSESNDWLAWVVKGLGSAKLERFRSLIQDVFDSSPNPKVRQHARLALDRMPRQ